MAVRREKVLCFTLIILQGSSIWWKQESSRMVGTKRRCQVLATLYSERYSEYLSQFFSLHTVPFLEKKKKIHILDVSSSF